MLLDLIRENRVEVIRRTREKVRARSAPRPTPDELESGVPLFLTQFTELLAATDVNASQTPAIGTSASKHGGDMLRQGFTVAQVVRDYGDICQVITELAGEQAKQFSTSEFRTLNLCLDNAIAEAVTEYSRQRDQNRADDQLKRLGFVAHEQRNLLSSALLALHMLETGTVAINGSTGAVLRRSLEGLQTINNRSITDIRLDAGLQSPRRIDLAQLFEEEEIAAVMYATQVGLRLTVERAPSGVAVVADRMILAAAVTNLLQNALKFTRAEGHVVLRARLEGNRILIEIEDECGGLPAGKAEAMFVPFEQHGNNRTGLGLGLSISRRGVEANGGTLTVRDIPGRGCVFTIDLAAAPPVQASPAPRRQ